MFQEINNFSENFWNLQILTTKSIMKIIQRNNYKIKLIAALKIKLIIIPIKNIKCKIKGEAWDSPRLQWIKEEISLILGLEMWKRRKHRPQVREERKGSHKMGLTSLFQVRQVRWPLYKPKNHLQKRKKEKGVEPNAPLCNNLNLIA